MALRASAVRRGSSRLAAAAAVAAVVVACSGPGDDPDRSSAGSAGADRPVTTTTTTTTTTTAPPTTATAPATTTTTAPPPSPPPDVDAEAADLERIVIPGAGVDAPVIALGLGAGGSLLAPDGVTDTGWWKAGPEPGEQGAAVIAGHVDSRRGPAVFYRLRDLQPGDRVEVLRADGSRAVFAVERVEQHPKAAFPTDAVYGATTGSALRLVTCGGAFDRSTGHYVDNVIVYAHRLPADA